MRKPKRSDAADAFLPDPEEGGAIARDTLAETLAEDYLRSATSAEEVAEDVRDEFVPEEVGGPFIEVSANEEFDRSPDASNFDDGDKEPFPRANRSPAGPGGIPRV